ncbi:hypothetical protein BS78_10G185100 [Paspalum vaginatum]|nr:hypothetical protein BS78_10G185100 [Paspalum vaginatum]
MQAEQPPPLSSAASLSSLRPSLSPPFFCGARPGSTSMASIGKGGEQTAMARDVPHPSPSGVPPLTLPPPLPNARAKSPSPPSLPQSPVSPLPVARSVRPGVLSRLPTPLPRRLPSPPATCSSSALAAPPPLPPYRI